jgi:diguanylate cyclase (GGDEF)-like protein/PAS domain S-box-containing protein
MTIRNRVILFIITSVVALVLVLYAAASTILLRSFNTLERANLQQNLERTKEAFDNELEQLGATALNEAHWTDMWEYARGENPDFFEENFNTEGVVDLGVNALALFDTAGRPISGIAVDLETAAAVAMPTELSEYLIAHSELMRYENAYDIKQRVIMLPTTAAMLVSAPIVQSDFSGDTAGSFVVMRFIDESFITKLENLTKLEQEIVRLDQPLSQENQEAYQSLLKGDSSFVHIHGPDWIEGHTLLKDNLNQNVLMLEVDFPRPIYTQALASRSQLTTVALVVMGFFSLAMYLLFQQSVARGFRRLTDSVQHIGKLQNPEARVPVHGHDEFAQLGNTINTMLEALEQTQQKLRASEARYALAATGVNDGLWEWDVSAGDMYFSARWMEMLGYAPTEHHATLAFWAEHIHPDDIVRLKPQLIDHLKGNSTIYEAEYRMRHQDNTYRWVLVRGIAQHEGHQAVRMAGSLTDITQRGVFDPLTGLPNRQLMNEYLKHAHSYSQRHDDAPAAVLFIDLNRFKEVNDSLGHQTGDLLLLEFSKRLQATLRGEDKIARLGGDEFVVLIEGLDQAAVLAVAERLSQETSRVYELAGHQVFSSSSIGIVTHLQRYEQTSDILRDADIAMYRSKAQKIPFLLFSDDMFKQVSDRQRLESDLRQAIAKQELFLVYQPVVNLKSRAIVGFETLLRWNHPDGLIPPVEFIPIAEDTGLIIPIGAWVLEQACRQLQTWIQTFGCSDLYITVNLSSRQLAQSNLVPFIQTLLEQTALPARSLQLEITESVIIENQQAAIEKLQALKDMGIRILMDDFGTGYSSLNYLTNLPIDRLKLDRSFINQIEHNPKILEVVRTILTLAKNVDMSVIAEGIETASQATLLTELECGFGQGYLFAKPQRIELIEALLQNQVTLFS